MTPFQKILLRNSSTFSVWFLRWHARKSSYVIVTSELKRELRELQGSLWSLIKNVIRKLTNVKAQKSKKVSHWYQSTIKNLLHAFLSFFQVKKSKVNILFFSSYQSVKMNQHFKVITAYLLVNIQIWSHLYALT